MKDLLKYIITQIIDKPRKVKIEEQEDETGFVLLTLTVAPENMGKVIGKGGKIIGAIRQILKIKAIKQNKRIALKLIDQAQTSSLDQPALQEETPPPPQIPPASPEDPLPQE